MPSIYFDVKVIQRSKGRSSVASAAYRSGDNIKDNRQNLTFDYSRKQNIIHSEILTPDNAPEWTQDRAKLWNMVEQSETRKDAQTARDITISLHEELTIEENKRLIQNYIKNNFVSSGMVADLAMHDEKTADGGRNLHAHIMLTMRELEEEEFNNKKNRDWNKKELVTNWRNSWEELSNEALKEKGIKEQISMTKDKNVASIYPVKNLSREAYKMESKGVSTYEGEIYKAEVMQFEKSIAHNDNAVIEAKRTAAMGGSSIHKNLYSQALQDLKYEKALEKQQEEKGKKPFPIVEDNKQIDKNTNNEQDYINRPAISWFEKQNQKSILLNDNARIEIIENKKSFVKKLESETESDNDNNSSSNSLYDLLKYHAEKAYEWANSELWQRAHNLDLNKYFKDLALKALEETENKLASVGNSAASKDELHKGRDNKEAQKAQEEINQDQNNNNLVKDIISNKKQEKESFTDRFKSKAKDYLSSWVDKVAPENIENKETIEDTETVNLIDNQQIELHKDKNNILDNILENNKNTIEENQGANDTPDQDKGQGK